MPGTIGLPPANFVRDTLALANPANSPIPGGSATSPAATSGAQGTGNWLMTAVTNSPDITAARVTRGQWAHFQDTYRGVEDEVIKAAMNTDFSAQGDEASATARASVNASAGTAARNISRSGGSLTAEEQGALNRRKDMTLAKSAGRAENTTRRTLSDTRTNLLAGIVGIGNGVSNTAMSGLSSAADAAAQRDLAYKQGKTATSNANMSMAASAAMLLISM